MTFEETRTEIARLRTKGLGWRKIELELGWPASNGTRAWRIANAEREKPAAIATVSISLWKHLAGGRSFKRVEAALAAHDINCEKGDVSRWEDRYEILVAEKDRERAEEILFAPLDDANLLVQATSNLNDLTR